MILFNDIYHKVGSNLLEQNYYDISIEEKKQLITTELKKYIISKLIEFNKEKLTIPSIEDKTSDLEERLSINELALLLSQTIPTEQRIDPINKTDSLSHLTHYILNIAGSIQSYSIIWFQENNEELIGNPTVIFNELGLWTNLTIHEDSDYIEIFNFVYDIFMNNFMIKKSKKQLLEKKKINNQTT